MHLAVNGTQSSFTWAVILWLKLVASSRSGADLSTLLGAIRSAWSTNMAPLYPSSCSVTEMKAVWIIPGGGEIVISNTSAVPGTKVGTPMSTLASCAVLNWRIDQYYRGGKPRTYMPGLVNTDTTDNVHLTTAALGTAQTQAAAFLNAVNALTAGAITSCSLGTVSFQQKKQWRDAPVFYPYKGVTCRSVMGIQRRRLLP